MENVGRLPFTTVKTEEEEKEDAENKPKPAAPVERVTVLADGTYATQVAADKPVNGGYEDTMTNGPALRSLILSGEYFLGVALCTALTKNALRVCAE